MVRKRQLAVHQMKIGATDTATGHLDAQLAGTRHRQGPVPDGLQRLARHMLAHAAPGPQALLGMPVRQRPPA